MTPPRPAASVRVTVAYAAPGVEVIIDVDLPAGAKLEDAIARSGVVERLALDVGQLEFAVFGQRANRHTPMVDSDRVEITRPLQADPKQVRIARAARPAKGSARKTT